MGMLGIVVIGRNEEERLHQCLTSLPQGLPVVYVDSGSTDNSREIATALGVTVVELDLATHFTAARARNAGFWRLLKLAPSITYVQFVDGDCELIAGWIPAATDFLDMHDDVAVVSGRLREKFPDRSIYNRLCDMEWDRAVGDTNACGGIAMMRVDAFESAQGFKADLIAGEEPELCVRLRALGWRIWSMGEEMALHDAAILRFDQWWKRTLRGGYAFAQGASLHGAPPERFCVRESLSIWFWGLGIPIAVLFLAPWKGIWALVLFLIYPLQIIRLAVRGERCARENWWRAGFLVLGKIPEMIGQTKFLFRRHSGGNSRLIEY